MERNKIVNDPAMDTLLKFAEQIQKQVVDYPKSAGKVIRITARIECGVTHPKLVYVLGGYSVELRGMSKGEPVLTLLLGNKLAHEYTNPEPLQNEMVIEAFAHHALMWLISNEQ